MSNWQEMVLTDEYLQGIKTKIFNPFKYSMADEYLRNYNQLDGLREIAQAQAKHTGELADAVIALAIYMAQKQERERLYNEMVMSMPTEQCSAIDFVNWFKKYWDTALKGKE